MVAEELEGVGDDFADQIAVGNSFKLVDKLIGQFVGAGEIGPADGVRLLRRLLGLLDVFRAVRSLHHSSVLPPVGRDIMQTFGKM